MSAPEPVPRATRTLDVAALERWLTESFSETPARTWSAAGLHLWPLFSTALVSLAIQVRIGQHKRLFRIGGAVWKAAVAVDAHLVAPMRGHVHRNSTAFPEDRLDGYIVYHANSVHCRPLGRVRVTPPLDVPAMVMRRHGQPGILWFENVPADTDWLADVLEGPARGLANALGASHGHGVRVKTLNSLDGFQSWCARTAGLFGWSAAFLHLWLLRQVRIAADSRASYDRAFDLRGHPTKIVMLNGGFATTVGLTASAKARGIPVFEVQHGADTICGVLASHAGPHFSTFNSAPDRFMSWDPARRDDPAVLPTGPIGLHLAALLADAHPTDGPAVQAARDYVLEQSRRLAEAASGAEREVIVSLQPGDTAGWLAPLLTAAGPNVHFWVRRHSGDLARRLELPDRRSGARVETELATRAALITILERAHVHVTRFSSVALEAAALGMPTLAMEGYARDLFSRTITPNLLHVETDPARACDRLVQLLQSPDRKSSAGPLDLDGLARFLDTY